MNETKMKSTYENWENGNITTASKSIKALTKVELLDFIDYCLQRNADSEISPIIVKIRNMLD